MKHRHWLRVIAAVAIFPNSAMASYVNYDRGMLFNQCCKKPISHGCSTLWCLSQPPINDQRRCGTTNVSWVLR
jgi:hypothetical protein